MRQLANEPIGEDWYDGQAQTALAHRIVNEIKNPSSFVSSDGKSYESTVVMALEGPWGCGKSNVIKMVNNEIGYSTDSGEKSKGEVVFVNYDLWMHRQDLTRKSVLESIVTEMVDKKYVSSEKIKKKLFELTGERISGCCKEILHVGWPFVICIGINAILVAISVWNSIRKDLFNWELTSFQVLIGLVLVGFCRFVDSEYRKLKDYSFESFRHLDEPTVTDFIKYLSEVSDALKDPSNSGGPKHVVLIFDNLDRLNDDEIKEFWTATHVLFAERRTKRPNNVQVIIPYDRARLRKAFGLPQDGDEYIRKVVDKVFVMPSVIMMDWSKFLKFRLTSAFDFLDELQLGDVIRVFDWLHRPDDLTPRAMISFVNDMVSVYESLRYDEAEHGRFPIPLSIVALYVLGWRRFDKLIQADNMELLIVSGGFIPETAKIARQWYLGDFKHSTQMAAVVYQLPEMQAAEILEYQRVGASLDGNMSLGGICRHECFHRVFSSVIKHVKQLEMVPRALATIDTSDAQKYWDEYYDVKKGDIVMAHGRLPVITEGEALIFANITKWRDYYMSLEEHLKNDEMAMFNENLQAQFAVSVEKALKTSGRTLVNAFVRPLLEPEEFVGYMRAAKENFNLLNIRCDLSKLDDWFDQTLGNGCELGVCRYLTQNQLSHMPKTVQKLSKFSEMPEKESLEMMIGEKLP